LDLCFLSCLDHYFHSSVFNAFFSGCWIELEFATHKVNNVLQVSRSIGDVYLKKSEYNREPLYAKFRLREPFKKPILSSEPSISVQPLQPHDQFVIFASDGLWEHLSNQEAVDIVHNGPRNVSLPSGLCHTTTYTLLED